MEDSSEQAARHMLTKPAALSLTALLLPVPAKVVAHFY